MQVGDGYFTHPKVLMVGDRAAYLHLAMMDYAQKHGVVPAAAVALLTTARDHKALVARLMAAGLLVHAALGYTVVDPVSPAAKQDAEAPRSASKQEAGRMGGISSGISRRSRRDAQLAFGEANEAENGAYASPVASQGGKGGSVSASGSVSQCSQPDPSSTEVIYSASRAREPDEPRFDSLWLDTLGYLPNGTGLVEGWTLIRRLAEATNRAWPDVARAALVALKAVMDARQPQYRSMRPQALVDNWVEVQRVMAGGEVVVAKQTTNPRRGQLGVVNLVDEAEDRRR